MLLSSKVLRHGEVLGRGAIFKASLWTASRRSIRSQSWRSESEGANTAWSQRALATLAGLGLGCALLANKASPTARAAEPGGRKVCIVGEALFDLLPVKTTDGKQAFLPRPGGAPLNVCIAASRMGAKVSFLGALSSDMFGEELYRTLEADNVDLSMVKRLPNPSTLAFVSKPPGSDVRYAFFKENAADRSLSARGVAELLSGKSFGALHVSLGAITLEDSVLAEAFEQAYKNTHSTKGFTSFDPNLRGPMVKSSPSVYASRIEAFAQHADLIKSSDADIEFLYGAGADLEAVAKKWLQKGAKLVVVTRGPDGATAYFRGKSQITSLAVKPPCESPKTIDLEGNPAPVADTVGAGDTCMGTLLCYLLGEDGGAPLVDQLVGAKPFDEAAVQRLRFIMLAAVTAAAMNVSQPGCDPPRAAQLSKVLSKMK